MQMGRHAAQNIIHQLNGDEPQPFWYEDKGSLATIGRNAGVADLKGFRFGGYFAWLAWALIHLFFLVDFRNRVLVFLEWAWAYVFYTRAVRVVSDVTSVVPRPEPQSKPAPEPAPEPKQLPAASPASDIVAAPRDSARVERHAPEREAH